MAANTHILAIPFPLQSHINPMLQLSKRLIPKGIRVTIVITDSIYKILQKQSSTSLIKIETVPDLTPEQIEHLDRNEIFLQNFKASITGGLVEIIQKHNSSDFPLKAIVYDSFNPWILEIAHLNGLKGAVLFTQTCSVCSVYYHLHKGSLMIPHDEDKNVLLPGMPVMGLKDLPTFLYDNMGSNASVLRLLINQFSTFGKEDWRLLNTFDELEDEIVKWMTNQNPILTIGPTIPSLYTDKQLPEDSNYGLSILKQNAFDQLSCMKWLDTKEDHSVIYVSFGSFIDIEEKQMVELSRGLVMIDNEYSFIWVVRSTQESKLLSDFISKTSEKGMIVNWCHQLEILSHRSVGCFITHCGWNSTLEALSLGVPMVAMPQWSDQTMNAKYTADVWKTGVCAKVDVGKGVVTGEEIVTRVKEVMGGEKGREIRRNALKWKDLAREAVSEGGSSDKNITHFALQLQST